MQQCNMDIREYVRSRRLLMWEIAEEAGISQPTLCRWMRTEMDPVRRDRIERAMKSLVERRKKELVL